MRYRTTAVLCLCLVFMGGVVYGRTIEAVDCSNDAVQAAIDGSSSGDTVAIPSGDCTWDQKVSVPYNKKIVLKGAGTSNLVIRWKGPNEAIDLGRSGSRLTGVKVVITSDADTSACGVHVYGDGWRVDHCDFDNETEKNKTGIYVRGTSSYPDPTGLRDNCTFNNSRVNIHGDASLTAHRSWFSDYKLGSSNFVFVEDCTFNRTIFGNSIDVQYGGNYVFRHNTVVNSHAEVHSATQGDGSHRAGRLWEIYDNTFICNSQDYAPFRLRGGTGVVFNNSVSGKYDDVNILLDNVRTYEGYCTSWPCRDQIGRGKDQWLWTADNPHPPQASEPAYQWNNVYTDNGSNLRFKVINGCENVLKEGRDFYNAQKPGYTPYPYPHPMRQNESSPEAPGNLRINN